MRHLKIAACAALLFVMAAGIAKSTTVYIDGTVSGCYGGDGSACANGAQHLPPGQTVNLINPVTLTLGPGTYTITNGALTGYYSAWNFSGGWVWNWVIATDNNDGTGDVFRVGYSGYVYGTQSAAAAAHDGNYFGLGGPAAPLVDPTGGPDNFSETFTLLATTKLDFFVMDYYMPDNNGGVALNIDAVATPLPATLPLFAGGLGVLGWIARRRKIGAAK